MLKTCHFVFWHYIFARSENHFHHPRWHRSNVQGVIDKLLMRHLCDKGFCHIDPALFLSPEPSPHKFLHMGCQIEQGHNLHEFTLLI